MDERLQILVRPDGLVNNNVRKMLKTRPDLCEVLVRLTPEVDVNTLEIRLHMGLRNTDLG